MAQPPPLLRDVIDIKDSTVQICAAIDAAQLTGSRAAVPSPAPASTLRREIPRTYSITRYSRSYDASSSTASNT